jgi:ATP-dependent helicase/nuclease subunit B
MAEDTAPTVYSIPAHRSFSDALVTGILAQFGDDPATLARGTILVPNNRAAMAIQAAFVRKSAKGLLMPRLVPIGDSDLAERIGTALDPIDDLPIPPAVDPLQRQFILARLLQQTMPVERLGRLDASQAMRLAAELGSVVDQLIVERKTTADLRGVDVSGLSEHWAKSLSILAIILDDWPKELASLGCIDLAERRNRQLERVRELWRNSPPSGFVIAAGVSTAAPAITDLLRLVSRLQNGQVVFAGIDMFMPDEDWQALMPSGSENGNARPIESHPQYHLRLLLDRIDVARASVEIWPWGADNADRAARTEGVSRAMAPAQFTKDWANYSDSERRLKGVAALEMATPAEEAQAIALALREAVEIPGRTVALVTPDRELARRVSAHLLRWGIKADDSAGQPLSTSLPGTLLTALANAFAAQFEPVSLLTLLKHPLVNAGEGRLQWLDGVRLLDLALRGPKPAAGLSGIEAYLSTGDIRTATLRERAQAWWQDASAQFYAAEQSLSAAKSFSAVIAVLRDCASTLAGDDIWSGPDGRAAADLISNLEALGEQGPQDVSIAAFARILSDQLAGVAMRPSFGGHPRIFIWGLLEAKLQSADLMILAGLNEGVWPKLASADPWLSPAIRFQLGLPSLDRRIGLSAHDLASALGAQNVLLSRAKRDARSPVIPSRFWLRLETFSNGFELPKVRYDLIGRQIDHGEGTRAGRPSPSPPAADRPRAISVTDVDGLKVDPFAYYAKKMLRLSALDAPGQEPDAKWRGTFLHKVLGDWGQKDQFAAGALLPRLTRAFDTSGLHSVVRAMWQPRFEEAAAWFEARVEEQRAEGREPAWAEVRGETDVAGVTLSGVADRIDTLPDGKLAIVDYKTGAPPKDAQVKSGFASQLGLLGFLVEAGGFDLITGDPAVFEYWSQSRGKSGYGAVSSPTEGRGKNKSDPVDFTADMFSHFEQAIDKWLLGNAPFTAKLHPDLAYSEYDHLMRYDEWQGRDG